MKTRLALVFVIIVAATAAWVVAQETVPVGPPQPAAGQPQVKAPPTGQAGSGPRPPGQPAPGQPPAAQPPTDARHYSYAIGLDIGTSFRGDKIPLDLDSVLAGVRDGLAGKDPQYSAELCQAAIERLQEQRMAALVRRNQEFLVQNGKAQGVQTTPSGLQYKIIKSGAGPTPTADDAVKVHYRGQLVDGTVFDESYGGDPATLKISGPQGVIPGWSEALQQMKVGDKWQLVIPANLAFGDRGSGDTIPPNATLIFEVELLGIEGK